MSNRAPDRYALPPELGNRDTTMWVAGKPFFLASAIKYIWRGWDHADDLRKALQCLEIAYLHEVEEEADFDLMRCDIRRLGYRKRGRAQALDDLTDGDWSTDRVNIRECISKVAKRVKELEDDS